MNFASMPLPELLDSYVRKRLQDGSPSTIRQYEINIRHLADFVGQTPTVEHLDADVIEGAMYAMKSLGAAPRTCNKLRDNMNALWNFAAKQGITKQFPELKRVKEVKRQPVAWTEAELRALWASCEEATGQIGGVPANLWWRGLHSIIWDTAERIEAVMQLRWSDVQMDTGWVTFRAETRKRGAEDNLSRLHHETLLLLKQIRRIQGGAEPLVLPWTLGRGTIYHYYNQILRRADLPTDRTRKFHCMRKSVASHFEAMGGDATRLLGHADRRTTTKHYIDLRIVGQKSAADVLRRPDGAVVAPVTFSEGVG